MSNPDPQTFIEGKLVDLAMEVHLSDDQPRKLEMIEQCAQLLLHLKGILNEQI